MALTILSVDADSAARAARNAVLFEAGFEVLEAATGADALRLASEKPPALVVLAIELPVADGLAVCRRLKADPRTAPIPVLHIASPGDSGRGYAESLKSGAQAYLQEPLQPGVLAAVATALVHADSREVEKQYAALFDAMSEGFALHEIIYDAAGRPCDLRYLAVNPGFERQTGLKAEEVVGRTALELFPGADRAWVEAYTEMARTRTPERFAAWFSPLGRWLEASAFQPEPGRLASVITDITERKRAEEALRESEAVLRSFYDGPGIMRGFVELIEGRIVHVSCNAAAAEMYGVGRESIAGKSATEAGASEEVARTWEQLYEESRRTGQPVSMDYARQDANGQERWLMATASYLGMAHSGNPRFAYTILDLTERKRAEEALRQSESRERARAAELAAIMDATPAAIFIANDPECRFMTGNRMAYELVRMPPGANVSRSAPLGERPSSYRMMKDGIEIPPEELPIHKAASIGQPVRNCEMDLVHEDGSRVSLLGDALPMLDEEGKARGAVGVFTDITEHKRAEARLRDAQKLESLGLLAGGVAHDFNNLLVGVIGNASLAQEMIASDHPAAEMLDGVIRTGEQAAHLTRQMLAYSGKGKFLVEALDLSAIIPEMIGLVRPSISKKIALHLDLEHDLPPVEADRGQVQQVFMNLAINAAEAIGGQEGLIAVRTGALDVDEGYTRLHAEAAELQPGKYVCLEVRDTGCGMDEATRARIFDPFFSTKFTGRGLGLAAVWGILRGHKGAMLVSSELGKGSCFTALFPASARPSALPAAHRNAALQGSGVILVVDDEQVVREMAKRALERRGYTVLLADSGLTAIDRFKRHPGDIALVLLDLSMPNMNGEETLPYLRRIRPDVRVVVSSGYSESEALELFKGQRVSGFIQKPYTSIGLAEKVKLCLG